MLLLVIVVVVEGLSFWRCRCRYWFYCRWFRRSLTLLLSECYSVADVGVADVVVVVVVGISFVSLSLSLVSLVADVVVVVVDGLSFWRCRCRYWFLLSLVSDVVVVVTGFIVVGFGCR